MSRSVRSALASATARLNQAGLESGARDARALMAAALGIPADRITLRLEEHLPTSNLLEFEVFLEQRLARRPVGHILGKRRFWGREFIVSPYVLDPRPETEILIATALEEGLSHRILDLGTGSGIIAVTLLAEWRNSVAVATDISKEALGVADANAILAGVERRLETVESSWFEAVTGSFDLITSNPPYVSASEFKELAPEVRLHDPTVALTDGADGLSAFRAIAGGLRRFLEPDGRVLVEIGPDQAAVVSRIFMDIGLECVAVHRDFDGRDRVVSARLAG